MEGSRMHGDGNDDGRLDVTASFSIALASASAIQTDGSNEPRQPTRASHSSAMRRRSGALPSLAAK
jgi:hypothetical protein